MPGLFDEVPWWTTADMNNALSRERDKKLPVRPSFFNALVPQVKAQDAAVNRPDPVERASLFPLATYPDGSTKLALPGMIAEDIPRAFTAPARAYRGEIADEDMISEGLNFAGNMAMTGSIAPKGASSAARVAANSTESAAPGVIAAEAAQAKGPRPEPGAFGPQGRGNGVSQVLAETDDAYRSFVRNLQENPQSEPTIGPPTPGVDPQNVRSAYESALRRYHRSGQEIDPYGPLDGPLGSDLGSVMDALSFGARAAGRDLDVRPRSFGSQYANLKTPSGDRWKVRVADHGNQSQHHGEAAFNIAPGEMSVDEFLTMLPTIYANSTESAAPGVIVSEAARPPRPVQMEVPFYRGSGHAQTSVDYSKPYWGTTDRGTADFYARSMAQAEGATPNVTPAVARFRNPMLVDAQGAGFSEIPFDGKRWSTDDLAAAAKERGHDGLVIDRLYDGGRWNFDEGLPATVAALGPGTVSSAFDPNTILYANSRASSAPGVLAAEAADKPRGIRAYHGSPHDFDRFDLSKIGTGEGAQAYGHGLYFAEREGVARSYRDALSTRAGSEDAAYMLSKHNGDKAAALAEAEKRLADAKGNWPAMEAAVRELRGEQPKGKMYEVNINADPADFLDWDLPLSQQSEKVRGALSGLGIDTADRASWKVEQSKSGKWNVMNQWGDRVKTVADRDVAEKLAAEGTARQNVGGAGLAYTKLGGNSIYSGIDKGIASQRLREAGIPGIRYLDQGSRTAGEGSRNYVVFDDALVEILRKYMNPPTAAAPGVLMYEGAKDARQ